MQRDENLTKVEAEEFPHHDRGVPVNIEMKSGAGLAKRARITVLAKLWLSMLMSAYMDERGRLSI